MYLHVLARLLVLREFAACQCSTFSAVTAELHVRCCAGRRHDRLCGSLCRVAGRLLQVAGPSAGAHCWHDMPRLTKQQRVEPACLLACNAECMRRQPWLTPVCLSPEQIVRAKTNPDYKREAPSKPPCMASLLVSSCESDHSMNEWLDCWSSVDLCTRSGIHEGVGLRAAELQVQWHQRALPGEAAVHHLRSLFTARKLVQADFSVSSQHRWCRACLYAMLE